MPFLDKGKSSNQGCNRKRLTHITPSGLLITPLSRFRIFKIKKSALDKVAAASAINISLLAIASSFKLINGTSKRTALISKRRPAL